MMCISSAYKKSAIWTKMQNCTLDEMVIYEIKTFDGKLYIYNKCDKTSKRNCIEEGKKNT